VETPVHEDAVRAMIAAQGIDRSEAEGRLLAGKNPTGRFVSADGVAALVAFLCGPDAADITGAVLPIDGGWSAQ
jgi:3-hydroxybutyrate dehydrogenase